MLLCDVAVGNLFATRRDMPDHAEVLGTLGTGFDAIHGQGVWESQHTGNLNYDEIIVYHEAQAVPSYLIVYAPEEPVDAPLHQQPQPTTWRATARGQSESYHRAAQELLAKGRRGPLRIRGLV